MELVDAVRERRTEKVFGSEPVPAAVVTELVELARWAPNHNLTNPWRFRVIGPEALERLKGAAGPEAGSKLDRAPTLICVSQVRSDDPVQDEEDLCAVAAAVQVLLLGATDRGLANYWRTPAVLRAAEGRTALGVGDDERMLGLIHLGPRRQDCRAPERAPVQDVLEFLD